ncbi:Uncharacterized protein APZ42_005560, partial [Daphnia magna]
IGMFARYKKAIANLLLFSCKPCSCKYQPLKQSLSKCPYSPTLWFWTLLLVAALVFPSSDAHKKGFKNFIKVL